MGIAGVDFPFFQYWKAGSERNQMDWLLKEFLFLGKIWVTDSEVIAFYMRAEASPEADKAPASLRD